MKASEHAPAGVDYVVRHGLRGLLEALTVLVAWTAFTAVVAAGARSPSVPAGIALATGEIGLLAVSGIEIWRAARREVVFAVHSGGVYFGSGQPKQDVPWDLIRTVEIFTERAPRHGIRTHRCVGVRATSTRLTGDQGAVTGGISARGIRAGPILEADMADYANRCQAGIRVAYRRVSGWRLDRARLADTVRRYAPDVAVTDCQDSRAG
jgi:hypothetical protein